MNQFLALLTGNGDFFALNVLLQSSVLAAAALLLARLFRHNAATRYAILYRSLVALPPLILLSMVLQLGGTRLWLLPVEYAAIQADHVTVDPGLSLPWTVAVSDDTATLYPGLPEPAPGGSAAGGIQPWLYLLWLGGTGWMLRGLIYGVRAQNRIIKAARPVSPQERHRINNSLARYLETPHATTSGLSILVSDDIRSPVVAGIRSPVLMLPPLLLTGLSDREIGAVLLHEVAHLRRRDLPMNLVQKLVMSLFWFHPLVRVMDAEITRAREEVCDNFVLGHTRAVSYGEVLLKTGQLLQCPSNRSSQSTGSGIPIPQVAMGIFSDSWRLESRIADLLSPRRNRIMALETSTDRLLYAAVIAFALLVATCQVGAAQPPEAPADIEPVQAPQPPRPPVAPLDPVEAGSLLSGEELEALRREARRQLQEVEVNREEIRRTIQEAREQIQVNLLESDIQGSIEQARAGIQEQLAGLNQRLNQQLADNPEQDSVAYLELAMRGLTSALESLDSIDIVELQRTIQSNLETELQGLEALDLEFEFDVEMDVDLEEDTPADAIDVQPDREPV